SPGRTSYETPFVNQRQRHAAAAGPNAASRRLPRRGPASHSAIWRASGTTRRSAREGGNEMSPLTAAARRFRAAHHGPPPRGLPLVLPNVWDAVSARVFADAGFGVLATSSGAVAEALGYADGQRTPPAEMFAAITRITRSVDVPVTADIEAGYGLAPGELAERLR